MTHNFRLLALEERIVLDAHVAAAVIYVNAHAAPGGDGSSWAHAYSNLNEALAKASSTTAPEQIWVAKGTYTPAQGTSIANTDTFNLGSNVSIYGGFAGNEKSLSQRNPTANLTILSGALDSNPADNAFHVVTANGTTGDLIDGVTIINGNASASGNDSGGGLLMTGSSVALNNVSFSNDSAMSNGGAIAALNGASLTITSSSFAGDVAGLNGGAIASFNDNSLSVSGSTFTNNSVLSTVAAPNGGGAINSMNTNTSVSGDTFTGNHTALFGGAVLFQSIFETSAHTYNISGSTFNDNTATLSGGAVFDTGVGANPASVENITSSTFTGNSATEGTGGAILDANLSMNVSSSIFTKNTADVVGGAICINVLPAVAFGVPITETANITTSIFTGNEVYGAQGPATQFYNAISQIFGIDGSQSTDGGGAIVVHENASATITNSIFAGNIVDNGDGGAILTSGALFHPLSDSSVNLAQGGSAVLSNDIIAGNRATNGGGVASESAAGFIPAGSPTATVLSMSNNIVSLNHATNNGGGLYLNDSTDGITNNVIGLDSSGSSGHDVYGTGSIVNGQPSSNSNAVSLLESLNTFLALSTDDVVLA